MIAIVDYGLGNIQALVNIYKRLNIPVCIAKTPDELARGEKVILPGVGAFDWAITRLNESGMRQCLDELVLRQKRPLLGICVGMQMLGRSSDEGVLNGGVLNGLEWIDGHVRKFDEQSFRQKTHLPHMGWNDVTSLQSGGLFLGLETGARFYFLHSYYFAPHDTADVLAVTDYNGSFASSVQSGNIYGVQFHPEKSHRWGVRLLKNFAEL
jgi:imidazole glycerol-phosphate synthase subunit HisH